VRFYSLRRTRLCLRLFAIPTVLLVALSASAESHELKAAFIYRIASMTTWPASAIDDLESTDCFAIVDDDSLVSALNEILEDRMLHGRHLRAHAASELSDLSDCLVVFFASTATASELQQQNQATSSAALTLGDGDDFAEAGGMIQFVREGHHLRFVVNLKSLEGSGLKLSSKVLRLAREIID